MQGFPKWFKFPDDLSNAQAMKQLGNSVAVPAIQAVAEQIIKTLNKHEK
jgi:DNA (cytosine-5)-methyltransferase 1